jgi:hypothetical protein
MHHANHSVHKCTLQLAVIPANAGIHSAYRKNSVRQVATALWIPAYAGMTLLVFAFGAVIEFFGERFGDNVTDAIH